MCVVFKGFANSFAFNYDSVCDFVGRSEETLVVELKKEGWNGEVERQSVSWACSERVGYEGVIVIAVD